MTPAQKMAVSVLLLILFCGSWWLWLQSLDHLTHDEPLSPHIFFALLLALWMAVGYRWLSKVPKAQAMAVILLGGALVRLLLLGADPILSDDLWRYLWDGEVQRQGLSPYGIAPDDTALDSIAAGDQWQQIRERINHQELPTVYPPMAQGAFLISGRSESIWRGSMVAIDLVIGLLLCRILHRRGSDVRRSILWCWHPLPILESAIGAHVHFLALLLLGLALIFIEGKRRWGGAGFLSLSTATLLVPAGLVFHLVKKMGWASLAIFCGGLFGTAALYLSGWSIAAIDGLGAYAMSWYSGGLLFEPIGTLFGADVHDANDAVTRMIRFGLIAAWLWLAWAVRDQESWRATRILMLGFILLTPTLHPWYALWLLLPTVISPSRGALLLTITVLLNYRILDSWRAAGVWEAPQWNPIWVFSLPLALLLYEAWQSRGQADSIPTRR